ncbi:hypothetical protein I3V78_21505 [Archangium primigenium]|nr:hypothetical protein [Archangium primigenium]
MKNAKTGVFYWLLTAGLAGALIGSSAEALPPECYQCRPCGCSSDGGQLQCCGFGTC